MKIERPPVDGEYNGGPKPEYRARPGFIVYMGLLNTGAPERPW